MEIPKKSIKASLTKGSTPHKMRLRLLSLMDTSNQVFKTQRINEILESQTIIQERIIHSLT